MNGNTPSDLTPWLQQPRGATPQAWLQVFQALCGPVARAWRQRERAVR